MIGGALALFSIVFLMPHMETIASLVVLVACAAAIGGCVGGMAYRNFTSASVVSFGRSSEIQWPVFSKTTTLTSVATSFIYLASSLPNDFSPPIANTGMVSLVCDSFAKSLANRGHETK